MTLSEDQPLGEKTPRQLIVGSKRSHSEEASCIVKKPEDITLPNSIINRYHSMLEFVLIGILAH
jgi:hypothetical protein